MKGRAMSKAVTVPSGEVRRTNLHPFACEKSALDGIIRVRVAEALATPRPTMSLEDAFAAVRAADPGDG
jgi:antitoxin ParD1/3/4